jgi:hypothetical protein
MGRANSMKRRDQYCVENIDGIDEMCHWNKKI